MKRPIAAGMVALAVAIVVWRTAARSATSAPAGHSATSTAAIAKRKADPRQVARAAVAGRVSVAGKPVAGAHVCAEASGLYDLARDASCTDSDATGAYALGELLTADYRITANARGMRPRSVHQHLDAGAHASVDLALETGGVELSGIVTDIAGGPIAHAQLRADEAIVEADDQGRFSLWVEPADLSLTASADGYAPATWSGHPPDRAELRLQPESSLSGTVVAADGSPVPGAKVEVDGVDWHLPSVQTTSSDDGAFHAERLAPGRYTVTVRAPTGVGTSDGSVLVQMAEHADGIVVTLVPAAHLEATVLAPDGKPCTEGWVRIVDEDHNRQLDADTDATGALEIDGVLPGTYRVHITCTGFVSRDADPIEVRDSDVTGLVWKVEAGATVRGHIKLEDGTPVAGADVRLQGEGWGSTTSAADGSYTIAGLSAGAYTMTVTSRHAVSETSDSLEVGERETVEHDFAMKAAGAVRGVVVDGRGAPVTGAEVRLRDTYATARTSADGSFLLDPVVPGEHELAITVSDYHLTRRTSDDDGDEVLATVTVNAGETATTRLVIDIEPIAVTGIVVDGNGAPMRDVVVDLLDTSDNGSAPVLTGDDGAFRFAAIKGAHYRLHASAPGRGERTLDVEPGEPLRVQLEAGSLTGIVRGAPEELTITLSGASYLSQTFFHTGGRFAFHDLHPGHYTIQLDSEAGHLDLERDVADGPSEPLDLALDPVFTLTGRVVREDSHAPIAGAHVQVQIAGTRLPDDGNGVVTDGAGRFTLRRARRGIANVRIVVPGEYTQWRDMSVTGPELEDVTVPAPESRDDGGEIVE